MSLRRTIFILLLLVFSVEAGAQVIVYKDPVSCMYGLKRENGEWIAEPKYTSIEEFHTNSSWRVLLGDKYGMINAKGEEIVKPEYDEIEYTKVYHSNSADSLNWKTDSIEYQKLEFAFIVTKNGFRGIIDPEGKTIIPVKYYYISDFFDGIAVVEDQDDNRYFAGVNGITGKCPVNISTFNFGQNIVGRRRYIFQKTNEHSSISGVCDEKNKIIIPCKYSLIKSVYSGIIAYEVNLCALFDKNGNQLTSADFKYIYSIPYTNLFIGRKNKGWGIIKSSGEEIIPFTQDTIILIEHRNQKKRLLCSENGNWNLRDENGNKLLNGDYEQILDGSNYLEPKNEFYIVRKESRWGALLSNGDELVKPIFDTVFFLPYIFFWSPNEIQNLEINYHQNFVAYVDYQAKDSIYYPEISQKWFYFTPEYVADTSAKIFHIDYPEKNQSSGKYGYAKYLGSNSQFSISTFRQTISPDSSLYILHLPPKYRVYRGEVNTDDPEYEYEFVIKRNTNGKTVLMESVETLHDQHYSWISVNYFRKETNFIIGNDGKIILDSISGVRFTGFGFSPKGEPWFYYDSIYGSHGIIDAQGKFIVQPDWWRIYKISDDSIWVERYAKSENVHFSWNIYLISKQKLLLNPKDELLDWDHFWINPIIAANSEGFGLFNTEKLKFICKPEYVQLINLEETGYYLATTRTGKSGILNKKGKLISDTIWDRVIQIKHNYISEKNKFEVLYLFVNDQKKMLADENGLHEWNEENKIEIINSVSVRPPFKYYFSGTKLPKIAIDSLTQYQNWHYDLLFDSLYLSGLIVDYRSISRQHYNEVKDYGFLDNLDLNWSSHDGREISIETSYVTDSTLSFRKTIRIDSWSGNDRIYQNYFRINNQTVWLPLDSLFNRNGWRDTIISSITQTLQTHPYYDAPCMNLSGYIYLLREKYLIDEKGSYLYPPGWINKENCLQKEFRIFIPWNNLKPYLKPEIAAKIGLK